MMTTYTVVAELSPAGRWVLQCLEFPGAISEARNLASAPELMREAIAFVAQVEPETVRIEVQPVLPEVVSRRVEAARDAVDRLETVQRETAELSRMAVKSLIQECGLSGRDAALIIGVSPQRVSQLVHS